MLYASIAACQRQPEFVIRSVAICRATVRGASAYERPLWSWQPSRSPGDHSCETLRSLGSGPSAISSNEALVPLKADLSHNADGGKVQRGNTSMRSKPLEPHELDKFAHCDARALRATRRGVSGRDARSRRQPEHCFAIDTAAAPQWLSPNSDLGRV
jgi:hypothetical protein